MPGLDQLPKVILQHPALFGSMTLVPVISAVQILIPPRWVPSHLIWPSKIRLVFDLVKNTMYRFLKRYIHFSHLCGRLLNRQTPLRPEQETSLPGTIHHWHLTFALQPVIL